MSTAMPDDFDAAIADYSEIIKISPNSDVAFLRRSQILLRKGDNRAALRDADRAVDIDGKDPANYIQRAAVMQALKRPKDAIADYQKALTLNVSDSQRGQAQAALKTLGAR